VATAEAKLRLAEKHLLRVQSAWDSPTDWDHLTIYGLYCLEAAVEAAAIALGMTVTKQHWNKANIAAGLHQTHDLPDIEALMRDLNEARKAEAYGDIPAPDLDPEEVATDVERYVDAVRELLEKINGSEEET
jgi:hypothetical protein